MCQMGAENVSMEVTIEQAREALNSVRHTIELLIAQAKSNGETRVKVKPLVWRGNIADAFGMRIELFKNPFSDPRISDNWFFAFVGGDPELTPAHRLNDKFYASTDEAKAAAQAWYEAKIRECLE